MLYLTCDWHLCGFRSCGRVHCCWTAVVAQFLMGTIFSHLHVVVVTVFKVAHLVGAVSDNVRLTWVDRYRPEHGAWVSSKVCSTGQRCQPLFPLCDPSTSCWSVSPLSTALFGRVLFGTVQCSVTALNS
jgi:hypothetical protein